MKRLLRTEERMTENISWKLRIEHLGFCHLWLSWSQGNIHFDPITNISPGDLVILLGSTPKRINDTAQAISEGKNPVVVAAQEIIDWLRTYGDFQGYADKGTYKGITISLTPYEPFPAWVWPEGLERIRAGIRHPRSVLKKILAKQSMPKSMPRVAQLRFPSGATLVHANLSLHRLQQKSWLESFTQQCSSIDWLIAGVDYKQAPSFTQNLSFFDSPLILVTDLLSDSRKEVGLPTQWLTPVVDSLLDQFREKNTQKLAFVFAPHASFRFNNTNVQAIQETK